MCGMHQNFSRTCTVSVAADTEFLTRKNTDICYFLHGKCRTSLCLADIFIHTELVFSKLARTKTFNVRMRRRECCAWSTH